MLFAPTVNAETGFCDLHREISPLSMSKKHQGLYAKSYVSTDTTHDPPPLSFYNTFNVEKKGSVNTPSGLESERTLDRSPPMLCIFSQDMSRQRKIEFYVVFS